jgi:hypothetical protein
MLETLAIVLIILWVLGLVSSYTLGGFIHILLVIAIVVIVLRVIRGWRVIWWAWVNSLLIMTYDWNGLEARRSDPWATRPKSWLIQSSDPWALNLFKALFYMITLLDSMWRDYSSGWYSWFIVISIYFDKLTIAKWWLAVEKSWFRGAVFMPCKQHQIAMHYTAFEN